MRPKYLEISAWGPYKDVVKIDFEVFDKGALFLITGPTGSGKTTIFDGICFAIYGNASGKEREKTTLRSDFADPDISTYVKFVFTHNDLLYEVYRNPEYLRPKKRKNAEGNYTYTKEKENAILKMPDGDVLEGVTTVNRKLLGLMGLDYSQFKQISMIAQGEFDRLLTAPSQEKTKIFRGIFGTEKYDLFTQALKNKAAESYRKVNEYTHRMEEDIKIHARGDEILEKLVSAEHLNFEVIEENMSARMQVYASERKNLEALLLEKEEMVSGQQLAYNQAVEYLKKQEKLQQAKERFEKLQNTRGQYEETQNRLLKHTEAESISKEYEMRKEAHRLVEVCAKQTALVQKKVEDARNQYLIIEEKERTAYDKWQQADASYKRASIGIVAEMLVPGKSCPVCGSLEHPSPFKPDGAIPDAREVEQLKKVHEKVKDEQLRVYGQVQALLESLRKATEEEQNNQLEMARCNELWQEKLAAASFQSEAEFLTAKLSKEIEKKYRDQVAKWEELVTSTKAVLEHMTEELKQIPFVDAAAVEKAYQAAREEREMVRRAQQRSILMENQLKNGLELLRENMQKAAKCRKEYGVIKDLENMATGNNSKRLVFEQYVLSSYFEDILAAANIRFRHMTMDRYEMIRKTEVSDARTKDHLDITIMDYYTGKTRSVSTLSGGERFHASLALALGMSDVIQAYQGGIRVETLFVDEGFGSLDEDALQAACDTLYQLTQGDKLVGIISHVESLKQRIDNRIEICKTNKGSTLKIVMRN